MQRCRAFTLVEITIAVAILVVALLMAVPSLSGVIADRKLRASLDQFNNLVRQAQERSVNERRSYLIVWGKSEVTVQPEAFTKDEEKKPVAAFPLQPEATLILTLPAALTKNPPVNGVSGRLAPASLRPFTTKEELEPGPRVIQP